ncbi:MAG: glycosyltransferase family 4 protein [Nitrospira sp.]|nr:glycosyltransferase family 4 protein [Nitrospira sp.]
MKILFAQADFGGCGFYRILQPTAYLKFFLNHDVKVIFEYKSVEDLLSYDLIILQRQNLPEVLEFVKIVKAHNRKVVYEIDDDLWHIPPENESKQYWGEEKIRGAETIMQACDAITTSTEPLAELLRRHNKNVFVITNYIPEVNPLPKFNSTIRVGWSGSASHRVDFNDEIIRALKDIKRKYKNRIELVFCGWIPEGLVGHVTFYEHVAPMYYLDFLNQLRLHIGIIPCADNKFNECKSNLKFLEYSITKTASIASPIYPYIHTITENTGILLKNGAYQTWVENIERLIEDTELRTRLTNSAYEFVKKNYLIMDNIKLIEKTYEDILKL